MKITDTIKESAAKYTVEWILGLISPLLAGIALGLKKSISEKLLPVLPKGLLFGIVVGCISLLSLETAYVIYLRRKLREKKEPALHDLEIKIITFIAKKDSPTKQQIISHLGVSQTEGEYYLARLSEYKYIYVFSSPAITYSPGSNKPATYHLTQKGRELVVTKKLISDS